MRTIVICVLVFTAVFKVSAQKPNLQVAITFDDLPSTGAAPPDVTRAQIIDSLLATLKAEKLPPIYGFINAHTLEGMPSGPAILRAWTDSGNLLGSHTYSHPDLESISAADFEDNILKNETALKIYAGKTDWHYFRYPFLHEGETLEKRQAIQFYLKEHGYKTAEVSLDFEDYLWNDPYARCVTKNQMAKVDALHDSYLAAADQFIDIYRSLSSRLYGHDIRYVLLLHVTAFNAKMLPDLIALLRERGFAFISLQDALRDPAYSIDPTIGYPGGGAIEETLAAARKLAFPPAVKPNEWLDNTCK
ncbi:polysaccharide deacetylase family protein [Acidipila sp. EB88]|uniref:polysaccharide deacetylase family protein n=1 Tax=Acidipila sp. EB88 TaxID=2305226 RepID=UPI000F5D9FCC|nr:polysaccharide deacetylase family protein [Acidipila sp. EB88]RRA50466.1 polysaccharide deacetylase [Acidipila sp. EB88]